MSHPAPAPAGTRALRVTRGVTVASASTLVSAVGHVAGGGTAPDLALLLVLFPLLAALLVTVAGACRSLVGMLAVLAAGQFAMHEIMDALGHQHAMAPAPAGPSMFAMHAVATVVMGLLIRDADVVLVALIAAISRVLLRRLVPPVADRPLRTFAVPSPSVAGEVRKALLGPLERRGPPAWV